MDGIFSAASYTTAVTSLCLSEGYGGFFQLSTCTHIGERPSACCCQSFTDLRCYSDRKSFTAKLVLASRRCLSDRCSEQAGGLHHRVTGDGYAADTGCSGSNTTGSSSGLAVLSHLGQTQLVKYQKAFRIRLNQGLVLIHFIFFLKHTA